MAVSQDECFPKKQWQDYAVDLGCRLPKELWEERVVEHLSEEKGHPVGIACSGGLDSLCLLLLSHFHFPENKFIVLHFNHGLRGEESDGDEAFMREVAAALGLIFFSAKRPPNPRCSEADLREDRYAFFENVLLREGGHCLLLGHHWDDVCESWIMRTVRGASLGALVAPLAVQLIGPYRRLRPLIHLERKQLAEAMGQSGIPWREDSSNGQDTYLRNRVRHHLLPRMEEVFSQRPWRGGWSQTWRQIGEADEALRFFAHAFSDLVEDEMPNFSVVDGQPRALYRYILEAWLERRHLRARVCGANFEKLLEALFLGKNFRCSLGDRSVLGVKDRCLGLTKLAMTVAENYSLLWQAPCVGIPGGVLKKSLCHREKEGRKFLQEVLRVKTGLREDQLLLVRNWRPGDAYRPLGFQGHKKLKKMFQERRIPIDKRRKLPVIALPDSEKIIWVPFLPLCEDFRVPEESRSALELTFCEI
ncbi:MAG: tRNA lysidine(34) synthetase TilS [Puniceicoccales bacterium]|nr:tRNA lysidine(34) synthetase TilS [Puniceicoccales bacterium]